MEAFRTKFSCRSKLAGKILLDECIYPLSDFLFFISSERRWHLYRLQARYFLLKIRYFLRRCHVRLLKLVIFYLKLRNVALKGLNLISKANSPLKKSLW